VEIDTVDRSTPDAVDLKWVARRLAVSLRTAGRLAQERAIPGRLHLRGHDRLVRFDRRVVEDWLDGLIR
jgi:hypothetical protein